MSKYRDTEELLTQLNACKYSMEKTTKRQVIYNAAINDACRIVDALPVTDVVEVQHGEWIELPPFKNIYVCSLCGQWGEHHWGYCPNCGAKMDEECENESH